MVISTDYEIVCIAKIGCLSLKHLGTALVNTAARLFWRILISNQNAFYNSISQRNTGVWAMNEKQKLFPKVWRTLKYKTEYTHTHCINIIFMGYSGVFFNANTGGNSNWVKFTCKVTWPRQR